MQQQMMTVALLDVTRASYEIINANDGVLTVANMRPFSRGTVTLSSARPFDPPIIDPRYASNPTDIAILQAAMDFNQRLIWTNSLSRMNPAQRYPPAEASEAEILSYIHTRWQTEYHPGGTCAMMPLELGGVVSPELLVYGTQNLRVVDSSILPLLPAAHLQAVVYGVAEKVCLLCGLRR
jgi:choline dehydrogenase-like flavoprotein